MVGLKISKAFGEILGYLVKKAEREENPTATLIELATALGRTPETISKTLSLYSELGLVVKNRRTKTYVLNDVPRAKELLKSIEKEESEEK